MGNEQANDGKQQLKDEGPTTKETSDDDVDDVELIIVPETTLPDNSTSLSKLSKNPPSSAAVSSPKLSNKTIFTVALVMLSGITEGICFHRFRCFPNMMTGNTIRGLDALADGYVSTAMMHGSLILAYVAGGALFKFLDVLYQQRQQEKENAVGSSSSTLSSNNLLLVWVARVAFVLFGVSDLMGCKRDMWRLPPLALGFGMINAATMDVLGVVTNAVTGHWTKIGVGMAERALLKSDTNNNKGYRTSLQTVGTFVSSMLVTNLVYRWLETQAPMLLSRLPPLGMSLGVLYTSLLTWYSRCDGQP
jgi:uncharacterized membrane protein YoaK (UPF0700 family)